MILSTAIAVLTIFISIILHETAHGWVAHKLGDNTAKNHGRLTLNPLKHIDIIGTIILPLILFLFGRGFIFGWAKPVPVNYNNFKKTHRDIILVASAGIITNFTLAFLSVIILKTIPPFPPSILTQILTIFFMNMLVFNIFLAIFNLLPIPPLDGSKILLGWSENAKIKQFLSADKQGIALLIFFMFIIPSFFEIFNIHFNPLITLLRFVSLSIINLLT